MRVRNIKSEPLVIGRCIKLSWDNPEDENLEEVVVIRRKDTLIYDIEDEHNVEIYRGNGEEIFDFSEDHDAIIEYNELGNYYDTYEWLEGERLYYYIVYCKDNEDNYYADRSTSITEYPTYRYGLGEYLYNSLPEIYHLNDRDKTLKRFCDITGEALDFVFSKINLTKKFRRPGEIRAEELEYLAEHLGWRMDKRLPLSINRMVVSQAVNFYKLGGTKKGIDALVRYYSGYPFTSGIMEARERDLFTVDFRFDPYLYADRVRTDFEEDPQYFELIGQPGDPLYYLRDFGIALDETITVFIGGAEEEEQEEIEDRINRVLEQFKPVGVDHNIEFG